VTQPGRAFRTSLAATASNPLTIVSWAGVFAAASTGTGSTPVVLVLGVGLGSATWVCLLACGVAAARRSVGPRVVTAVDVLAGIGLLWFAGALGWRTVSDSTAG
jgi:putative LysE/RhtB family amino acid efflux pump